MDAESMKYVLVGGGYWGSKLLRNLVAQVGADRVTVADTDPERRASSRASYPAITTCDRLETALDDPLVGAVVVATPVHTHAEIAELALLADCDVLVEKPLTSSVDSAQGLVALASERSKILMVGHTFLYSPRVQWIAQYVRARGRDDVHYITSSRLNLGIHRPDVNVIWDLAPHDISVACHLLDEFPTTVSTSSRSIVRPEHPDVAFMNFTFDSGIVADIAVSWLAPRKVRTLTLVAESGMVVYDDVDPEEPVKVHDRGVVRDEDADFGMNQLTYRYGETRSPYISVEEPLARQLREFVMSVEHRTRPISDGEFGLNIVAALEAADRSWREGGAPVPVRRGVDQLVLRP
jgi:predicted dehydrogenase